MITRQEIESMIKEKEIPYNAIFSDYNPKKLAWGGAQILEAIYGDKLNWICEEAEMNCEEYAELCKRLGENDHIQVFSVDSKAYNNLKIRILADEETKTTMELAGGLENYIKMGG